MNSNLFKAVFVVFYLHFVLSDITCVKTTVGLIHGKDEDVNVFGEHSRVSKYLGIPYAESPVGELRFQKPVPKTPLQEPLNAVQYGNACLQVDIGMQPKGDTSYSEDCLYLNIYAPKKPEQGEKLAVMVWFHGGGFIVGSADIYPADHLAVYGDVVVVTVNYRLTVFGFLSTGDEHAPGNYGLWDQRMALDWVNKNIEGFGGDPARVTIFGESAGAASVIYQGLYPDNRGLFQRLVAQSGSAGSWWASNDNYKEDTEKLAKLAGCATGSSRNILTCLKAIPGETLLGIVDNLENGFKAVPIPFIPRFDKDFVKLLSKQTFVPGNELPVESRDFFRSLDIMVGMNCGEGSLSLSPFFGVTDPPSFLPNKTDFKDLIVPAIQNLAFPGNTDQIVRDAIIAEYTSWENPDNEYLIRDEFLAMHSDFTFTDPLYRALDYHSESTSNTYMYYFDEVTTNHLFGNVPWYNKLGHGDEIPFIFGFKNADHVHDWKFYAKEWEAQLSKSVMKLWANFAKTGNTNLPDDLDLDWLPYTRRHQHYLQISRDMTSLNVKQRWNTRRANFWGNLLPSIVKASQCARDTKDSGQQSCPATGKCPP
ncbi:carboxylesterase 5A-like [Ruditapes philippinarum]|uniref:carboxylesterase 5A-like n=1 Tax=Ruditapes philippinarum TaxID=129788 RepID=UPI00295B8A5C|nr:carboxylesterase 5A-like [Ruditapes philippinarum]